jgi:hypothetical protein
MSDTPELFNAIIPISNSMALKSESALNASYIPRTRNGLFSDLWFPQHIVLTPN